MKTDSELISLLKIKPSDKIVDIGGSAKQHDIINIDCLVDVVSPEKTPYWQSKLKAKKFIQLDITVNKLPFKDKAFDVALCTQTLEDLYNPFLILEELQRVAKRGYISTPARGQDCEFSHIDMTDWQTGPRRVPGHAHHYWLFEKIGDKLVITPKIYPLLYTREFQISKWAGETEMQMIWNNKFEYKVIMPTNFHELIENYRKFMRDNSRVIKRGLTVLFLDKPYFYIKSLVKLAMVRIRLKSV